MGFGDQVRVTVAQWLPMVAVLAAVVVLWELMSLARRGATPGMRGAGIKLARWDDGSPVGLGRALLRWAVSGVPLLIGVIAFVWALWGGSEGNPAKWLAVVWLGVWVLMHASVLWGTDRRGWRDKLTGTMVVQVGRERPGRRGPGDEGFDRWQRFMHGAESTDSRARLSLRFTASSGGESNCH